MSFKEGDTFNIDCELFDKIACEYIRKKFKDKYTDSEYLTIDNHLGLEYYFLESDHYCFVIKDINKFMLAVLQYGL